MPGLPQNCRPLNSNFLPPPDCPRVSRGQFHLLPRRIHAMENALGVDNLVGLKKIYHRAHGEHGDIPLKFSANSVFSDVKTLAHSFRHSQFLIVIILLPVYDQLFIMDFYRPMRDLYKIQRICEFWSRSRAIARPYPKFPQFFNLTSRFLSLFLRLRKFKLKKEIN